jgi:NTP pyrophosphatase (non-canonical NTP hydrolase)
MNFKEIQKEIDEWINQHKMGYWSPHENFTRIVEEVGELGREINHLFGPKKKKSTEETNEIGDEIADIIFSLGCLANSQGIDLDEAFGKMMKKYRERDGDRWEKKE